jgi:hypothetical protein
MSYTTMSKAVRDQALVDRVNAAAQQEARNGPQADSELAAKIRSALYGASDPFMWWVASDTEEAYAYALDSGNPNPGGDEGVITDAAIGSAIQAHWPPDAEPAP